MLISINCVKVINLNLQRHEFRTQLKRKFVTLNTAKECHRNKNTVIDIVLDAFVKTGVLQETWHFLSPWIFSWRRDKLFVTTHCSSFLQKTWVKTITTKVISLHFHVLSCLVHVDQVSYFTCTLFILFKITKISLVSFTWTWILESRYKRRQLLFSFNTRTVT